MKSMPVPESPGSLRPLQDALNLCEEDWRLVAGWLVAALIEDIPHPILVITGEQGSAKTTTAKLLVDLIDPSPAPARTAPEKPEDWAVAAAGSWATVLDNLSSVPKWLSDALCKAVTGDGYARRERYTDDGIAVSAYRRCLLLTGIDLGRLSPDLVDRALRIELEPIAPGRRRGAEVEAEFRRALPQVLGGLLSLLSRVLARLPEVHPENLPRMADFAKVLCALDEELGWSSLDTYLERGLEAAKQSGEDDPVFRAVRDLVGSLGEWEGTATQLMEELKIYAGEETLPKSASAMSGRLKKLGPPLRAAGIDFTRPERSSKARTLKLWVQPVMGDGDGAGAS